MSNSVLNYAIALQELKTRTLSVFFILLMFVIFSGHYLIQYLVRKAIFAAVILTVINNIYDFFHPLSFSIFNVGRPAGFYINPNQAAAALVLGLIFSIGILKPKYRFYFLFFVGVGVLVTLSRGAILGWLIIAILLIKKSIIAHKQILYSSVILAILALVFLWYQGELLSRLMALSDFNPFYEDSLSQRLEWLSDPSISNSSESLRVRVMKLGWDMFTQNPLLGKGIAATLDWSETVSTHNMYLYYMVDHGIFGAFILPILVWSVTRQARGEAKHIGLLFSTFVLFWGLFSHNILSERYILITFALMGAMTMTSRREQKYRTSHACKVH
ncbi:MAG: O-antigen ligase family protein [Symploca sp. SIO2D2]|nr:O-antigen ligase family protein [Symploca sp. SIO2D2]